ncbi:MAG: cobyrinate a,c-diamide synthase [Syntrophobacteraceae bacterium]|nr:cobyrinate a,c-diamide synthase [Syntrophobacteraceae bacterium]
MEFKRSRLMIAALRGGAGKTVISLGLAAAWKHQLGLRISAFKKGPDYIDSGWLSAASGGPCYNLDQYLMSSEQIVGSFAARSAQSDGSLIEGNRGIYDGVDAKGSYSTAELAKLLACPVVLVVDAAKVTRTVAAMVLGCQKLDPGVNIAAVILNQVSGKRHEKVLRESIEKYCGIPVLGVVPRQARNFFPERHLGLVPAEEAADVPEAVLAAADVMGHHLDVRALWELARSASPLAFSAAPEPFGTQRVGGGVKIGVIRDSSFQFYYPENFEALEANGASLVWISSLEKAPLPEIDALYIGGGFPETHLEQLAANQIFRDSILSAVEAGLPVYAECGGLMFLCRGIRRGDVLFPMTGVFPFEVSLGAKPQGHGYTLMRCVGANPFFPLGTILRGHEFHYSGIAGSIDPGSLPFAFKLEKGHGVVAGWDGLCYKNVLATYSHLHAAGNDLWARSLARAAESFKSLKATMSVDSGLDSVRPGSRSLPVVY